MLYIIWNLIFLLISSVIDLKDRKVFPSLCVINVVSALILHFIMKDISWINVLFGMILGGVIFVISVLSKEAIGKGDSIVIFTSGCICGANTSFKILVWSLSICSLLALIGIATKKVRLKSRLPFVPFMLAGGIAAFVLQGG